MWVCAERLGNGLQVRIMQVRFLSPTPVANKSSVVIVQHFTKLYKKVVDKKDGMSYTLSHRLRNQSNVL